LISVNSLYKKLLNQHGQQGWWPLLDLKSGASIYRSKKHYSEIEKFEIFIGAILTQGISWKNVEKALFNLKIAGVLDPYSLKKIPHKKLAALIKPTGYFNQKSIKVKNFINWFDDYNFSCSRLNRIHDDELRKKLLSIKGIGPETADSMLNYGLGRKIFVVDAYTKRILSRLGFFEESEDYHAVQGMFHKKFTGDAKDYRELHSLIVVHGSTICKKKPLCTECSFGAICIQKSS
jgi:endonuclease-3 related protein